MLLASVWYSFLVQALVLLFCQYTGTMSRERDLICFSKVNFAKFSKLFSRIELISIIYVRYCHQIWGNYTNKIGSSFVFWQYSKTFWGTYNMLKCCDTWISIYWEEWVGQTNLIVCNTLEKYWIILQYKQSVPVFLYFFLFCCSKINFISRINNFKFQDLTDLGVATWYSVHYAL